VRQIKPAQLAFRCTINIILLTYLLTSAGLTNASNNCIGYDRILIGCLEWLAELWPRPARRSGCLTHNHLVQERKKASRKLTTNKYPKISLLWLRSRQNKAFLPFPWMLESSKASSFRGASPPWPPDQGLCSWTPLGAPPPDPRYRLALRALAMCPSQSQFLDPPLLKAACSENHYRWKG